MLQRHEQTNPISKHTSVRNSFWSTSHVNVSPTSAVITFYILTYL